MALLRLSGSICRQLFEPTHHCLINQLASNPGSKPRADNHSAVDRSFLSRGFGFRSAGFNGSLMLQKIAATFLTSPPRVTGQLCFIHMGFIRPQWQRLAQCEQPVSFEGNLNS